MTDAQMHTLIESAARRLAHRRAVERGDPAALTIERRRAKARRKRERRAARKTMNAS
jgi:hypothetical protein